MRISDWSSDVCSSDLLNIKQVDIIGHDMGLIIAYAYAALYPNETQHIILMDGFIPGIPGWETAYNGNPAAGIASKWHFRFFGKTAMSLIQGRSEEHTSELQSLMRTSYAVFCSKKKNTTLKITIPHKKTFNTE